MTAYPVRISIAGCMQLATAQYTCSCTGAYGREAARECEGGREVLSLKYLQYVYT